MDGYPFAHDVRVRFAETDAQGIAHHASFVVWLEEARVAFLERYAGGYQHVRETGIEALTVGVHLEYRASAAFHDLLTVWTRVEEMRGARFRFGYVVTRSGDVVAEGHTDHAVVDAATHRPVRVPAWLADALATATPAAVPGDQASPREA